MNLSDEIRDEFLVTTERKKIWGIQIEMLEELLRICGKHDIGVFAVCGTLLGAVRHQGFIPWDDDIDVGLLREDYEKLLKVANDEFEMPLVLQTSLNEEHYFCHVARLRNSNTTGIVVTDKKLKCNNGIFIDIFPFDALPDNILVRKAHLAVVSVLGRILYSARKWDPPKFTWFVQHKMSKLLCDLLGFNRIFSVYQKVCSLFSNKQTERVAIISGNWKSKKYYFFRDDLSRTTLHRFENITIPIPEGYDRCLRINYGEYLRFPPIDERGKWHEGQIIYDPDVPYAEFQRQRGWLEG